MKQKRGQIALAHNLALAPAPDLALKWTGKLRSRHLSYHIASKTLHTFFEERTHQRLSASRCSFKSVNWQMKDARLKMKIIPKIFSWHQFS